MGDRKEVELMDQLLVLWRWKWVIAVCTLFVVAVTAVVTLRQPPQYEASAILLVSSSKLSPSDKSGPAGGVNPETFVGLMRGSGLAAEAVQRHGLDRPPYALTIKRFLSDVVSVKSPKGTSVITVTALLPDAKTAAEVANFIAQRATELNAKLNQSDAVSSRDYIERERNEAAAAMDKAQQALTDFLRTSSVDSLRTEQTTRLDEKDRLTKLLATLRSDQAAALAEVTQWTSALKQQQPIVTLRKSFVDPAAAASLKDEAASGAKGLSKFDVTNEETNWVYQNLQQQAISGQVGLAALEKRQNEVEKQARENDARLSEINARLAVAETKLNELRQRYDLASESYGFLSKRLNDAIISVAAYSTDLKLVDRAVPPELPAARGLLVKLVVATFASLVTMFVVVVFVDYVIQSRRYRSPVSSAAER